MKTTHIAVTLHDDGARVTDHPSKASATRAAKASIALGLTAYVYSVETAARFNLDPRQAK